MLDLAQPLDGLQWLVVPAETTHFYEGYDMNLRTIISFAIVTLLFLSTGFSYSADQERIYGSQLMTQQERLEHREKLRNAKTNEERERIRKEHHERMKERAKAQGKTLPDDPPIRGGYMEPGGGAGSGGGGGAGSGGGGGGGGR